MKKKLIIIMLFASFSVFFKGNAFAAKKRPPRGWRQTQTSLSPMSTTQGVKTHVAFRPDRNGLLLDFLDFGSAMSVNYTLSYNASNISQGVTGTVTSETAAEIRELLFGTCSHGVCIYHSNITNAKLVIDSLLPNGTIVRKPYQIKV